MKIFKSFTFTSDDHADVLSSDKTAIGIDISNHNASLKKNSNGYYDVEDDVVDARWVRSKITTPAVAKKLLKLHSLIQTYDGSVTGFLLGDGTNAYQWDGAQWSVVDPNSKDVWNTEDTINDHIESFASPRSFCVYIRLGTTNKEYTPVLDHVAVLIDAVPFSYDVSARDALVSKLESDIRYITKISYEIPSAASTINFSQVVAGIDETLQVVEPLSVYNYTDDPNYSTDLFSSYNSTTKVITLTGEQASGKTMVIFASCRVPVTFEAAHTDWIELEKAPAIVLADGDTTSSYFCDPPFVVNKAINTAYRAKFYQWKRLSLNLIVSASRDSDLKMLEAVLDEFIESNGYITIPKIDERMVLVRNMGFKNLTSAGERNFFTSSAALSIIFNAISMETEEKFTVKNVSFSLKTN